MDRQEAVNQIYAKLATSMQPLRVAALLYAVGVTTAEVETAMLKRGDL